MKSSFGLQASPTVAVELLPLWLEQEAVYANAKYLDTNPQLQALAGGLGDSTNAAFLEVSNYYDRFWDPVLNANGEPALLIKASQSLGKMIGANRALLRVCLQAANGVTRQGADEITFDLLDTVLPALRFAGDGPIDRSRRTKHWAKVIDPALVSLNALLPEEDPAAAAEITLQLIEAQAELWTDFTCQTGLIAAPGINSSDPEGILGEWFV